MRGGRPLNPTLSPRADRGRDPREAWEGEEQARQGGRSAHLDELLQAAEPGRDLFALGADPAAPVGEADFTDIDVAARIDGEPVRRDELAGLEPGMHVAEARQQLALMGIDANPRP